MASFFIHSSLEKYSFINETFPVATSLDLIKRASDADCVAQYGNGYALCGTQCYPVSRGYSCCAQYNYLCESGFYCAPNGGKGDAQCCSNTISTDSCNSAVQYYGLSTGAKAGIAVGIILFFLILIGGIIACCMVRRRRRQRAALAPVSYNMDNTNNAGGAPTYGAGPNGPQMAYSGPPPMDAQKGYTGAPQQTEIPHPEHTAQGYGASPNPQYSAPAPTTYNAPYNPPHGTSEVYGGAPPAK